MTKQEPPRSQVAVVAVGLLSLALLLWAGMAHSATVGDKLPAANFGTTCVLMDDGGSNVATPIWDAGSRLTGSNTFSVLNPTGSSGIMYCGWRNTVTSTTGFPVCVGCSLSVDITCPNANTCPMLYCTTGSATVNQTTPNCTRYLQVK